MLKKLVLKKLAFSVLALALYTPISAPQSNPDAKSQNIVLVKAARLLDVNAGRYIENAAVLIEGERIQEVGPAAQLQSHAPKSAKIIDLPATTLLPGLIDCHTHLMGRTTPPDGYILDLAKKSQAFRALEGAADARLTLHAGFTSVRDVESEGSGYADVALRDAIEQGLVEGPRMRVATPRRKNRQRLLHGRSRRSKMRYLSGLKAWAGFLTGTGSLSVHFS